MTETASRGVMTDRELIAAYAQSRDPECLGVFLMRYQGSLVRFAARLLGDRHAAQDVVQETFLQVARHPRRLLRAGSCHNWLLAVARNIGVSRIRRDARQRRHAEAWGRRQKAALAPARAEAPVLDAVEAVETGARVHAAIDRLPPRAREAVLLKLQEDKTYREIAQIMGLTVSNVGYILHRAMTELAAELGPAREGEGGGA